MVELACFGAITRDTLLLTNSFISESPALAKLIQVLLSAGDTNTQDQLKMGYWAMEIETYHHGTTRARKSFRTPIQYGDHGHLLNAHMNKDMSEVVGDHTTHDLYTTHISFAPTCSNPTHTNLATYHKKRESITIAEHWYSMPQDWTRVREPNNKFSFPNCTYKKHTNVGDVMGTLVGRTDGETTDCKTCFEVDRSCYQLTHYKNPNDTVVPLFLEFDIDPALTMPAEKIMTVGNDKYILMGVVFGDGNHFKCNVLMDKMWYHYDDLGMNTLKQDENKNRPAVPRMTRLARETSHMTPPELDMKYKPISFRYMRMTVEYLGLQAVCSTTIPRDLQFNNMSRLMS